MKEWKCMTGKCGTRIAKVVNAGLRNTTQKWIKNAGPHYLN